MIQRIQTVFLFLAAGLNAALLFLSVWHVSNTDILTGTDTNLELFCTGYTLEHYEGAGTWTEPEWVGASANLSTLMLMIFTPLTTLVLAACIFLFKNRPLQAKVAYAGMFLIMVEILMAVLASQHLESLAGTPATGMFAESYQSGPRYGLIGPALALLFTWLAARRIRRDERLVKESNRLR